MEQPHEFLGCKGFLTQGRGSREPAQDRDTAKRVNKQRSKDVDIICYVQCKASLCFLIEIIHLIIVFLQFIHCITVFLSLCIVLSFFFSLSIVISFFLSLCIVLSFSFSLSIVLPLLYYQYCITVVVLPFFIQWTIVFTVFLD